MNLKSILSSSVMSGMLAAIALAPTTANATSDYKEYHASGGCKVYGATPWTSLGFGWQGVNNTTSSPVQIICPIVTDSETAWTTAAANAYAHIHARSGGVPGTVTCVIYSSYQNGLTSSTAVSIPMAANTNGSADSANLTSYSAWDGGVMMLCQLGAKTMLQHYGVYEYSATNTP
jgi:hypothetical protein